MKVAFADLKYQNKHSFKNKKKHEDGVTVIVRFAYDKDMLAAAEYSEIFSETDQSAYQEMPAVTSDFNNPREDYLNYISTGECIYG